MKKKLRNITVNDRKFMWWYLGKEKLILSFTPKENKNQKVSTIFDFQVPKEVSCYYYGLFQFCATFSNEEVRLKV